MAFGFDWKMLVRMALPMIEMAGEHFIEQDENDTGKDDMIGQSLLYAAKLLKSVLSGKEPPKAPEILQ